MSAGLGIGVVGEREAGVGRVYSSAEKSLSQEINAHAAQQNPAVVNQHATGMKLHSIAAFVGDCWVVVECGSNPRPRRVKRCLPRRPDDWVLVADGRPELLAHRSFPSVGWPGALVGRHFPVGLTRATSGKYNPPKNPSPGWCMYLRAPDFRSLVLDLAAVLKPPILPNPGRHSRRPSSSHRVTHTSCRPA